MENKIILITGAAGMIGQAIAQKLVREGARLILFERTPELAERACTQIEKKYHQNIHHFSADLETPHDIEAAIDTASRIQGGFDGLVNNAAMLMPDDSDPVNTSLASWNKTLAVNLTGTFLMCQAVLPFMLARGGGTIVNMSSIVAHSGSAIPQIAYTTSKGGIEAMTREIAICYARQNIRANCVAPGPVLTDRTAHYFDTAEKWHSRRKHIPAGRLGRTEEIAALIAFLLSDAAKYITASSYKIDGGISSAYLVNDANGSETP